MALKRNGFRVIVLEQAGRLEETGAGIQLSPNAARLLLELGLGERLRPHVVTPEAVRVLSARNGREIVRIPLGDTAAQRYGAPYWIIHRGDLQAALAAGMQVIALPDPAMDRARYAGADAVLTGFADLPLDAFGG